MTRSFPASPPLRGRQERVRQAPGASAMGAAVVLAVLFAAPAAWAADAAAGKTKAQMCAMCHGVVGISVQPDAPNLAGQPELYVSAQLKAYRDGGRKHEVMSMMAKPLTDADIANLAAWFASIKIEAQAPK